jgi:hypothetical protein
MKQMQAVCGDMRSEGIAMSLMVVVLVAGLGTKGTTGAETMGMPEVLMSGSLTVEGQAVVVDGMAQMSLMVLA